MNNKLLINSNFRNSQNYVLWKKQKVRLYLTLYQTIKKKVWKYMKTIYNYNINSWVVLLNDVNDIDYKLSKKYLLNFLAFWNFILFMLAYKWLFEELKAFIIFVLIFIIFFWLWFYLNKLVIKFFFYKQYLYLFDKDKFYYLKNKDYYDIIFENKIVKLLIKISFLVISFSIVVIIYLYFFSIWQEFIFYSYSPMLILGWLYIFRKIK